MEPSSKAMAKPGRRSMSSRSPRRTSTFFPLINVAEPFEPARITAVAATTSTSVPPVWITTLTLPEVAIRSRPRPLLPRMTR
jgi:hypothetical protein